MGFFSRLTDWLNRSGGAGTRRILVVDDDPAIQDLVKDILSSLGYAVETAGDGVKGLESFRRRKYDLLIIDGRMPRVDGLQLLDAIRSLPAGARQPVIMLSAENMLGPINKAYELGIAAFIPKPFTAKDLITKVQAALQAASPRA
ncbi:MAG TPA: response regulator [Elusimicrobiota bacterium]|nr:response regulator [Elusimicrobiota bacterium]